MKITRDSVLLRSAIKVFTLVWVFLSSAFHRLGTPRIFNRQFTNRGLLATCWLFLGVFITVFLIIGTPLHAANLKVDLEVEGDKGYIYTTDGITKTRIITDSATILNRLYAPYVALSPDGKKVVFLTAANYYLRDTTIWTANIDGSERQQIAFYPAAQFWSVPLIWSPDNTQLAYTLVSDTNQIELWTMLADGSNKKKVLEQNQSFRPEIFIVNNDTILSWSSDGNSLEYIDQKAIPARKYSIELNSGQITSVGLPNRKAVAPTASLSVPYFSQTDPTWGNYQLGSCAGVTIRSSGCAMTSVSMIFKYYGANTNPQILNNCLIGNGGYLGCAIYWGTAAIKCSENKATLVGTGGFNFTTLEQELAAGYPVVVGFSWIPHYVVVVSGSGSNPANYIINDPNPAGGTTKNMSYYGTPDSMIRYHGTPPPPPVAPPAGDVNSASCTNLTGWAWDPKSPNVPITVHLYKEGSVFVQGFTADVYRSDVSNLVSHDNGLHGFDIPTPNSLKDGLNHTLSFYALATGATGPNPRIDHYAITINCVAVTSISLTPLNTINQGTTQQFTAIGTYPNGTTQDITSSASWSSNNTSVATVNASGLVTPVGSGYTYISASKDGVTAGTFVAVRLNGLGSFTRVSQNLGISPCSAPTVNEMAIWMANSPYRDIRINIGGVNLACPQPNLTPTWVSQVSGMGWGLIPTWVGLQGPSACNLATIITKVSDDPVIARQQGIDEANAASNAADSLGLRKSIIYYDMGYYSTGCTSTVQAFADGWTLQLTNRGYLSGFYGDPYHSSEWAVPGTWSVWLDSWASSNPNDNAWYNSYTPSVWGVPGISDTQWSVYHQRMRLFRYWHSETYGGVTLGISTSIADAPVALANTTLPIFTVGQGSSFPQKFIDVYNWIGGDVAIGQPADTVKQYGSSGVYWQPFSGATYVAPGIFHYQAAPFADSIRAFFVNGDIYNYYKNMGGPSSWLGAPTTNLYNAGTTSSALWQGNFANGYITLNTSGVYQAYPWPTSFSGWKAQYFNNTVLSGGSSLVKNEVSTASNGLDFGYNWPTWLAHMPDQGLTFTDSWSARWERTSNFAAGTYNFTLCGDDGVRLYLNNTLVIDQWKVQNVTCYTYTQTYATATSVPIKIEYYQGIGGQSISFSVIAQGSTSGLNVIKSTDDNLLGSLSYALNMAGNGQIITFDSTVSKVTVTGILPALKAGVILQGRCNAGKPGVTIEGFGLTGLIDSLVLSGRNTLYGVQVTKFSGKQIKSNGSGNKLSCVVTTR